MEESRNATQSRLDDLSRTVGDLERRVSALEHGAANEPAGAEAAFGKAFSPAVDAGEPALDSAANLMPLFGWALLGLAGAYLLRSLTEAGAIPGLLGAGAGIAYAGWWLFLAAQRASEKRVFSVVHGLTAALILAPMMWEMTIRFRLIPLPAASVALILFAALGLAIGWRRNITPVAWVATLTALITALALFRDTHDAAALTITILLIATAVEFSACRDHWLSLRWIVAIAANLSVLLLAQLAARSSGGAQVVATPAPGIAFAAHVALLAIYLSSTVDRTIYRGLNITGFEIGQVAAAFLISVGGALRLAGTNNLAGAGVGVFCLAGGAACYMVSFAFLDRAAQRERNFFTYSTFALLVVAVGCAVLLQAAKLAAVLSVLAAIMMSAGFVLDRRTLRIHGAAYLLLALASAGLAAQATARIIRSGGGGAAEFGPGCLYALLGTIACYGVIIALGKGRKTNWADAAEATLIAGLMIWGAAGWIAGYLEGAPPRTALLTALALAAAWFGGRRQRRELLWLSYPLMAMGGLKLALEDLRQGQSLTLFASLIFFGGGLIVLPKLLRRAQTAAAVGSAPEDQKSAAGDTGR